MDFIIDNLNENDRVNLIQQADDENINVRNAFYGGRTEVFSLGCDVNDYG